MRRIAVFLIVLFRLLFAQIDLRTENSAYKRCQTQQTASRALQANLTVSFRSQWPYKLKVFP